MKSSGTWLLSASVALTWLACVGCSVGAAPAERLAATRPSLLSADLDAHARAAASSPGDKPRHNAADFGTQDHDYYREKYVEDRVNASLQTWPCYLGRVGLFYEGDSSRIGWREIIDHTATVSGANAVTVRRVEDIARKLSVEWAKSPFSKGDVSRDSVNRYASELAHLEDATRIDIRLREIATEIQSGGR